jgi:hypothetical protein
LLDAGTANASVSGKLTVAALSMVDAFNIRLSGTMAVREAGVAGGCRCVGVGTVGSSWWCDGVEQFAAFGISTNSAPFA